jgi:response regulator NasT
MISTLVRPATLKLALVEADFSQRLFIKEALENQFGHQVIGEGATGPDMIRTVLEQEPDVVTFDVHLPRGNGLEALRQIYQERPVAAVAICNERDQNLIHPMLEQYHLVYLLKPVEPHQLEPAVRVAWSRFNTFRQLMDENTWLRQTLENRKLIERAKGVLMKRYRWSEGDAFRRLQRGAMNRRVSMVQLAQSVLNGTDVDL